MAGRTGAGASVSSGADYQARVAAYAIAHALVGSAMAALDEMHAERIEHETREYIDDLIIRTQEGTDVYVQAKRQLNWSLSATSDFGSTIAQFARQHASGQRGLYALATTSASSRRITMDLSAALLAYRSATPAAFLRDQPASFATLITDLKTAIMEFASDLSDEEVDDVLKRIRVARLDLDDGEPLHQALRMRLGGGGFVPDDLVWAKLVADSLDASRRRITLSVDERRVRKLTGQIRLAREKGDPFCIIPEGQKSGSRSALLSMFGLSEEICAVLDARVEHFSKAIGARYPHQPPFYAPLSYLTDPETDEVFYWNEAAVVLTNPMSLARHLMNWQGVGFALPTPRLAPLLTDSDVDAFMGIVDSQGAIAVVDPVFAPDPPTLVSGAKIVPTERLLSQDSPDL